MSGKANKKRLLTILEYLYKNTDEENPTNTTRLIDFLSEKEVEGDRKTIADDIEALVDMGYDIVSIKSSPNKYFWGQRAFEIPELKLLIDAVCSSRFITDKKSKELTKKITLLAGANQSLQLKRHIIATGRAKTENQNIYYLVDEITTAINEKKQISFQYSEYNVMKEKILRHDGEVYVISPYMLYWNEDYYYVVGYSEKRSKVVSFRVDRMVDTKMISADAVFQPADFNPNDYADRIFCMFNSSEQEVVELECQNELMKYIIDRYGLEVKTSVKTENTFAAWIPVNLSPVFYSWVFQFGGKVKIISPKIAVNEYRKMLEGCLKIQDEQEK